MMILKRTVQCILVLMMAMFFSHGTSLAKNPYVYTEDSISFSGYFWVIKDSKGKRTGPGNNYFSSSNKNVFVDNEGKLHLRVTVVNDKWYCPEVRLTKSLGYGKYHFYIDPITSDFDRDLVVGLFIYDPEDSAHFHKEIDIEFSTWGKERGKNTQYVIQPKENEAYKFNTDFSRYSKHTFAISKKKVCFSSEYTDAGDTLDVEIEKYSEKHRTEYTTHEERISMNVWLYHTIEPHNLKEFEIVISKFEFEPFKMDKLKRKLFGKKK